MPAFTVKYNADVIVLTVPFIFTQTGLVDDGLLPLKSFIATVMLLEATETLMFPFTKTPSFDPIDASFDRISFEQKFSGVASRVSFNKQSFNGSIGE